MKKIIMAGIILTGLGSSLSAKEIVLLSGGDTDFVKFLLKGKDGSTCRGTMDVSAVVEETNCVLMTNAKKGKVLCTKKQGGVCKTVNEVYENIKKQINS